MKKLILISVLFIAKTSFAQVIKDVSAGLISSSVASTNFDNKKKSFEFGQGISASFALVTKKTVHNLMYNFGRNSVGMLNGYFLPKNWDVYVVYSYGLGDKSNYTGVGIEKMEKIGKLKLFEFLELGTGFRGKPIFTVGFLANLSWSLKKK